MEEGKGRERKGGKGRRLRENMARKERGRGEKGK